MRTGITGLHGQAVANYEATADLRHEMTDMETRVRGDIAARHYATGARLDGLREGLGVEIASAHAAVTNVGDAMAARFERAGAQFRGVQHDLGTVRTDVDFLKSDVGFLKEEVGAARDDVITLRAEVDAFKVAVDQRFNAVDQRFDSLDAKFDTLIAEIRGKRPPGGQ